MRKPSSTARLTRPPSSSMAQARHRSRSIESQVLLRHINRNPVAPHLSPATPHLSHTKLCSVPPISCEVVRHDNPRLRMNFPSDLRRPRSGRCLAVIATPPLRPVGGPQDFAHVRSRVCRGEMSIKSARNLGKLPNTHQNNKSSVWITGLPHLENTLLSRLCNIHRVTG